jgi:hypothetical protein
MFAFDIYVYCVVFVDLLPTSFLASFEFEPPVQEVLLPALCVLSVLSRGGIGFFVVGGNIVLFILRSNCTLFGRLVLLQSYETTCACR